MTFKTIFSLLATVCTVYSVLCSIRIVLTWIPGFYNSFTVFLSKVCDPFLNFFSRIKIFRFGTIDFSPMIGITLLALLSTLFKQISIYGYLSFALILSLIVSMTWNIIGSLINFFAVIFIVRLVVLLIQRNSYNGSLFWQRFDSMFNPFVYKIAKVFSFGRMHSYKTTLIITICVLIIFSVAGSLLIGQLCSLIRMIPF